MADLQHTRRPGSVAVGRIERFGDHALFQLPASGFQGIRVSPVFRNAGPLAAHQFRREMFSQKHRLFSQDNGPFNCIFQLADIARPVVLL